MLSRNYRLTKEKDFEILFKEGRFISGRFIALKVWRIDSDKYPKRGYVKNDLKIGFVVGKKVHKSAVKRNRIKRQMREIVRLLIKENKINTGYMVAFVAKPAAFDCSYGQLELDIVTLLKKSRLLRDTQHVLHAT